MTRALVVRSWRDNWMLLASCCALVTAFIALRVWVASKIKIDMFIKLIQSGLKFVEGLLPVSIDELASPLGVAAFSFEEFPVIVVMALWCVARGSDCLAGRIGSGTMEMLLAQPIRRIALVGSHSAVTLAGVLAIGASSWLGLGLGLALAEFDPPPAWSAMLPGVVNYVGFGTFLTGASTFASALSRSRSQAVALVIGFYVVELALMIVGRLSPSAAWMEWLTILSAYEPTFLVIGMNRDAATHWAQFWQYNLWLYGLGLAGLSLAAAIFCHRDLPAPL